tara:strand:- start:178 stop:435 length:258 start_codon:yes stop_codon:yes gene_type:complete
MEDLEVEALVALIYEDLHEVDFKLGTSRCSKYKKVLVLNWSTRAVIARAEYTNYYDSRRDTILGLSYILDNSVQKVKVLIDVLVD